MATSSTPTVMTTLKSRLQLRSGLAGVQITDGPPWQPDGDFIAIMGTDPHEQRPAGMGTSGGREEEFTLSVVLSALRSGDDEHTQAVARVFTLVAELENELRANPTLDGVLGSGWATVAGLPVEKRGPDNEGKREAIVFARVDCHSILE